MKWAHLPRAGGIGDQHPMLIDGFQLIFAARDEHDAAERKRQDSKSNKQQNSGSRASRAPRPRRH